MVRSIQRSSEGLRGGSVVWAPYRKELWPALVRTVYPKKITFVFFPLQDDNRPPTFNCPPRAVSPLRLSHQLPSTATEELRRALQAAKKFLRDNGDVDEEDDGEPAPFGILVNSSERSQETRTEEVKKKERRVNVMSESALEARDLPTLSPAKSPARSEGEWPAVGETVWLHTSGHWEKWPAVVQKKRGRHILFEYYPLGVTHSIATVDACRKFDVAEARRRMAESGIRDALRYALAAAIGLNSEVAEHEDDGDSDAPPVLEAEVASSVDEVEDKEEIEEEVLEALPPSESVHSTIGQRDEEVILPDKATLEVASEEIDLKEEEQRSPQQELKRKAEVDDMEEPLYKRSQSSPTLRNPFVLEENSPSQGDAVEDIVDETRGMVDVGAVELLSASKDDKSAPGENCVDSSDAPSELIEDDVAQQPAELVFEECLDADGDDTSRDSSTSSFFSSSTSSEHSPRPSSTHSQHSHDSSSMREVSTTFSSPEGILFD